MTTHYGWRCAGCEKPTGNLTRVFCRCGVRLDLAIWGPVPVPLGRRTACSDRL